MNDQKKILLAEDDQAIAEITTTVLRDAGYDVTCPSSLQDIKKMISKEKFSLVLLDGWLWGKVSSEIVEHIKAGDKNPSVPIILLSAQANTKKFAKEIGADDVLEKPFELDALLEVVRRNA